MTQGESDVTPPGVEGGAAGDEPGGGLLAEPGGWLLAQGSHVSVALRSGRRRLGWSQRDLARNAGLNQATIARLESGADARFTAVVAALAACGLVVVAAPPAGAPADWRVLPHPADAGRDTGGRRLPAHLPAYPTTMLPTYTLWKRMVRGENLFAERPPHWLFAREAWPVPPDPPPSQTAGDTTGDDTPGGDTPGGDTPGGDTVGGDLGGDDSGGDDSGGDDSRW